MNVTLVSEDRDLYKLCREVLMDIPGHQWNITAVVPGTSVDGSDLCVWDYHPNTGLPECIGESASKHLFLVNRKDLVGFRDQIAATDAHILLKPVTRATLVAFLGLAVSAYEDRVSAANSLRADRDEILQCLIQTNLRLQEY